MERTDDITTSTPSSSSSSIENGLRALTEAFPFALLEAGVFDGCELDIFVVLEGMESASLLGLERDLEAGVTGFFAGATRSDPEGDEEEAPA